MSVGNDQTTSSGWLDWATLFTLTGALVYSAGWTYAYHYFDQFRLGLLMLNIPTEYFFIYGFWVFKTEWVILLSLGVVIIIWHQIITQVSPARLKSVRQCSGTLKIVIAMLGFLLSWDLAVSTARQHYNEQAAVGFVNYPLVQIWPKVDTKDESQLKTLHTSLPSGDYRLLLQNQDKLFLIKPRMGQRPRLSVVQLTLSEIKALRVLPWQKPINQNPAPEKTP